MRATLPRHCLPFLARLSTPSHMPYAHRRPSCQVRTLAGLGMPRRRPGGAVAGAAASSSPFACERGSLHVTLRLRRPLGSLLHAVRAPAAAAAAAALVAPLVRRLVRRGPRRRRRLVLRAWTGGGRPRDAASPPFRPFGSANFFYYRWETVPN